MSYSVIDGLVTVLVYEGRD